MTTRDLERRILSPVTATPERFAPYGQVAMPGPDGLPYGPQDPQLDLSAGTPRFYSMTLAHRGLAFRQITRHRRVTQCLGAMMGTPWLLGVCAPGAERDTPDLATLAAFVIPGDRFIRLHKGTWHAGPYFTAASALFFNLELTDTNETDHQSCDLAATFGLECVFGEPE